MSGSQKHTNTAAFTNADIFDQLLGKKAPTLWLGHYTEAEVRRLLEKFGILPALAAKGFNEIIVSIEPVDAFMQALKIFTKAPAAENLLAEFQLRETSFSHPYFEAAAIWRVLAIEWLLLQNPKTDFTSERPRLPGQRQPGLGLGKRTVQLLVHLAEQHGLAGILNFPEFFHNAYLTFEWQAEALVLPLDEKIKQHFRSADYEQLVYNSMAASKFVLDQKKFEQE